MKGPLAKEAGIAYLEEGTYTFTLRNGATFTIYASPYSAAFGDWAFGYSATQDRFNDPKAQNPVPDQIDILMTHGPPKNIMDLCPSGFVGCDKIFAALKRTKPLMHCFGHIHEGAGAQVLTWSDHGEISGMKEVTYVSEEQQRWGVKDMTSMRRGTKTMMVNAAIQGDEGQFCNPPWLVHLPLRNDR